MTWAPSHTHVLGAFLPLSGAQWPALAPLLPNLTRTPLYVQQWAGHKHSLISQPRTPASHCWPGMNCATPGNTLSSQFIRLRFTSLLWSHCLHTERALAFGISYPILHNLHNTHKTNHLRDEQSASGQVSKPGSKDVQTTRAPQVVP